MGKLKDTIVSNLSWSIIVLFGLAVVALWTLVQAKVVQFLLSDSATSIPVLGWILAILFLALTLTIAWVVYLQRLLNNPFRRYPFDDKTQTAIDPKTGKHYCPTCLLAHKTSPSYLIDREYLCANKKCPNSNSGFKVSFEA
jgi:hypothetical protein